MNANSGWACINTHLYGANECSHVLWENMEVATAVELFIYFYIYLLLIYLFYVFHFFASAIKRTLHK